MAERIILALAFPDAPHSAIQATPSLTVLGFAFLLSLATGVVFEIVPAWMTSVPIQPKLCAAQAGTREAALHC